MAESVKPEEIVSVAIVENDAETREGWVKLLEGHPRVKCVAACESGEAAIRRIPDCRPQVILRTHLQHIYEKLHVHCRTEAAAKKTMGSYLNS